MRDWAFPRVFALALADWRRAVWSCELPSLLAVLLAGRPTAAVSART